MAAAVLLFFFGCLINYLVQGMSLPAHAQFNLEYVTEGDCQGPLPTVEFSLRSSIDGDKDIPQEFTQWKLIQYYTGNCSSHQTVLADQSPANGTKYQFRVEMSSGSPCHCVTLTHSTQPFASVLTAWTNGSFWCGTEQPNGHLLCAVDSRRRFFLSRIITVNNADDGEIAMCNENSLSSHNTTDLAVGYTGVFGTCPETQCSPLTPLQQDNVSVMINFSMILNLNMPPACRRLCNANEGMLLRADSALSTAYLHFYYDRPNYNPTHQPTRIPQFQPLDDNGRVQLTYDNHVTYIRIPGTLNSQIGLQNYSEGVSQIVDRVVRLKWEQHTWILHASGNRDCDTISLDSTVVSLHWNNCVRKVLDEDFDDPQIPTGWDLFHTNISLEEMLCLSTYPCLYFVGVNTTATESVYQNERFATSPVLDLRVVRAVKPPPAPRPVQVNTLTCDNGLKQMMITFQLMMTRYQYPTPCNEQDTTPKGVLLSVSGDQQLAYYAPLAHTNWSELILQDLENMRFTSSEGVDVPIWSPLQNQVTVITTCVNTTDRDTLEVVWRQDNFSPGGEHWYLHIEHMMVEDFIDISDISAVGSNSRYSVSLANGGITPDPSNCALPISPTFIGLTLNNESSRAVTLTITSLTPSSFPSPSPSSSLYSPSSSFSLPQSSASSSVFFFSTPPSSSFSPLSHTTPSVQKSSFLPSSSHSSSSTPVLSVTPSSSHSFSSFSPTTSLESTSSYVAPFPSSYLATSTRSSSHTSDLSMVQSTTQIAASSLSSSFFKPSSSYSLFSSVLTRTTISVSSTVVAPTSTPSAVAQCPQDGIWQQSLRCTRAMNTVAACSSATQAIRVCHCNGTWGRVHCKRSLSLVTELIEGLLPEEGLKTILELPSDEVTDIQRVHILRSALLVQSRTNISRTFAESFIQIVDIGLKKATQQDTGFDLINLMEEVALGLQKNATISLPDTKLVVQEVFPHTGPVHGIQTEDSYIILPAQLFRDQRDSVFVASMYYRNLSHLMSNITLISPVTGSTFVRSTSRLQENVSVFFELSSRTAAGNNLESRTAPKDNLKPRTTSENTLRPQCVFADQHSWSDSGCQTFEHRNGSVLCLCDRLAHYAVRLSPIQMTPPPQPVGAAGIVGAVFGVLLAIAAVAILVLIILFALLTLWKHKSKFPLHKNSLPKTSSASPTVELTHLQPISDEEKTVGTLVQQETPLEKSSADNMHEKDQDPTVNGISASSPTESASSPDKADADVNITSSEEHLGPNVDNDVDRSE